LAWALAGCSAIGGPRDALDYDEPSDAGQPEFTSPGCANEDGPTCPRSATAHCAVDLAAQGQMFCLEDYDCELVWLTPRCLDICEPIGLQFDELVVSKAAKQAQIDRYCGMGPCAEAPCVDAGGSWVATCAMGFCAAVHPDAAVDLDAGDAGVDLDAGDAGVDLDAGDAGEDLDAGIPDA
jgi:hypothetical protein